MKKLITFLIVFLLAIPVVLAEEAADGLSTKAGEGAEAADESPAEPADESSVKPAGNPVEEELLAVADEGGDKTVPSDVENVRATASDSSVTLTWDIATDDTGVVGYNIYYGTVSVTNGGDANYTDLAKTGSALEYMVTGLKNGTTYYFAVTAFDAAGNESEYYSNESSATPAGKAPTVETPGVAGGEAPKVVSASAKYINEVEIVFSEPVKLPAESPESAFTIQDNDTLEILEISGAEVNGEKVLLHTADQKKGISYIVTASISVEDESGNPIISGVSDVAMFDGVSEEKPETAPDTEGPVIEKVESVSETEIEITFNEEVNLSVDPTENFEIVLESDEEEKLKILKIELKEDDEKTVLLETEEQSEIKYILKIKGVEDKKGNIISEEEDEEGNKLNEIEFEGAGERTLLDLVAPESITNLLSQAVNGAVKLSWTASIDSSGDLSELILYKSKDKGKTYDNGTQIASDATSYSVYGLEPGIEYYFKITAKDEAGNESDGEVSSAILPATGPGIGFLALAALGAGFMARRKKNV